MMFLKNLLLLDLCLVFEQNNLRKNDIITTTYPNSTPTEKGKLKLLNNKEKSLVVHEKISQRLGILINN